MFKNILFFVVLMSIFCGCIGNNIENVVKHNDFAGIDVKKIYQFAEIVGNKHEITLIVNRSELASCMKNREYFAECLNKANIKIAALPFCSTNAADVNSRLGKEMRDFVIFLNSKGLKVSYLLRESFFINRTEGAEYIWGNGNPYAGVLAKLKEFWRSLPESAEMPTVIIAPEPDRWHDSNVNRPASLLYVWRKGARNNSGGNAILLEKSLKFAFDCRRILDLEQMVILVNEEVALFAERNMCRCGKIGDWLKKADAVSVIKAEISIENNKNTFEFLKYVQDTKSVFAVFPVKRTANNDYTAFLQSFKENCRAAYENASCAGIWLENWNELDSIWRNK